MKLDRIGSRPSRGRESKCSRIGIKELGQIHYLTVAEGKAMRKRSSNQAHLPGPLQNIDVARN